MGYDWVLASTLVFLPITFLAFFLAAIGILELWKTKSMKAIFAAGMACGSLIAFIAVRFIG